VADSTGSQAQVQPDVLSPSQTLDGFGNLRSPPPTAQPIASAKLQELKPSLDNPPGYYGPAGTPRAIIERLNREVRLILDQPDVQQRLADLGGVALPSSPEEMSQRVEREIARWQRVANLKKIPQQ
jgi:hypothetical protein